MPELIPAGAGRAVIRLPELQNVPLTPAVVRVIDHPHFQRLRRVRQLGPTYLVYPGAVHTRFEHSLGVYGTVVRYLQGLLQNESIRLSLDEVDVRTVLMAGLLHDIGHYPFAHTLEALHHTGTEMPRHENVGRDIVFGQAPGLVSTHATIASILERDVGVNPERVMGLVTHRRSDLSSQVDRFLQSIISSALDADKMDYLWRDSVHLGVPYGRNYDRDRLLNALTINQQGDGLAISSKGVISAEIFLFCRYTMYSEVYWHHTVRSLSAMLERAWADLVTTDRPDHGDLLSRLLAVGDDELLAGLATEVRPSSVAARILACVTHDRRRPYKRVITWCKSYDDPDISRTYDRLYALNAAQLSLFEDRLRQSLGQGGRPLPEGTLILDIPPRDKDKQPEIDVHYAQAGSGAEAFTSLSNVSSIVSGIGENFMRAVKKIRLFVHPDHVRSMSEHSERTRDLVREALDGVTSA